jgi:hypothetical protein
MHRCGRYIPTYIYDLKQAQALKFNKRLRLQKIAVSIKTYGCNIFTYKLIEYEQYACVPEMEAQSKIYLGVSCFEVNHLWV